MCVVALLMRAWIVHMRTLEVDAKVLADDVLMLAKGEDMFNSYFHYGYTARNKLFLLFLRTLEYFGLASYVNIMTNR